MKKRFYISENGFTKPIRFSRFKYGSRLDVRIGDRIQVNLDVGVITNIEMRVGRVGPHYTELTINFDGKSKVLVL
ncbi:MAG: hypothetical protein KAS32_19810 [Candidatus Peribacteraceae bacterium]|nr:hypothetical protein [Candidatus Peribacteraceae bacterium]